MCINICTCVYAMHISIQNSISLICFEWSSGLHGRESKKNELTDIFTFNFSVQMIFNNETNLCYFHSLASFVHDPFILLCVCLCVCSKLV